MDDNTATGTQSSSSGSSSSGSFASGSSGSGSSSSGSSGSDRWGSWLSDYQSGNYDNLPHDQITQHYSEWSSAAAPEEAYEATSYGYSQLPTDQFGGAREHLYSYSQEQGLDLSDLDLSSTDYQQWTPQDAARVTHRAYGQSGNTEKKSGSGGIPKPVVGLALAGALAFAASRVMGGKSEDKDKGEKSTASDIPGYTPPSGGSVYSEAGAAGSGTSTYGSESSMGSTGSMGGTMGSTGGTMGDSLGSTGGTMGGGSGLGSMGGSTSGGSSVGSLSGDMGTGSGGSMGGSMGTSGGGTMSGSSGSSMGGSMGSGDSDLGSSGASGMGGSSGYTGQSGTSGSSYGSGSVSGSGGDAR